MSVRSGFLWFFSSSVLTFSLRAGTLVILARLLTPAEFGIATVALVFVGLAQLVSQFGALQYLVQNAEENSSSLSAALIITVLASLVFAVVLSYASNWLESFLGMASLATALKVVALLSPMYALSTPSEALLTRGLKFRALAMIDLSAYLAGYSAFSLVLAHVGFGAMSLVLGTGAYVAIRTVLLVVFGRVKSYGLPNRQLLKSMLRYGSIFSIGRLGGYLATQGDNLVVGKLLGQSAVGYYSRAYQLNMIPATMVGTAMEKVLFPTFSRLSGESNIGIRRELYLRATSFMSLVTWPLAVAVVALGDGLVALALGPGWHDVVLPLQVLASVMFFRVAYKISEGTSKSQRSIGARARRQWLYVAIMLTATLIGARWGVVGVSIGAALAIVLNYFFMYQLAHRETGVSLVEIIVASKLGLLLGLAELASWATYALLNLWWPVISEHDLLIKAGMLALGLSVTVIFRYRWIAQEVQAILRADFVG